MKNLKHKYHTPLIIVYMLLITLLFSACSTYDRNKFNKMECPIIVTAKGDGTILLTDKNGFTHHFHNNFGFGDAIHKTYNVGDTILHCR